LVSLQEFGQDLVPSGLQRILKKVAIKLEKRDEPKPQLSIECQHFNDISPHETIPIIYTINELPGTGYHFFVMQFLCRPLKNRLEDWRNLLYKDFRLQSNSSIVSSMFIPKER
jgi:predicted Ser/Thr protein kinase